MYINILSDSVFSSSEFLENSEPTASAILWHQLQEIMQRFPFTFCCKPSVLQQTGLCCIILIDWTSTFMVEFALNENLFYRALLQKRPIIFVVSYACHVGCHSLLSRSAAGHNEAREWSDFHLMQTQPWMYSIHRS